MGSSHHPTESEQLTAELEHPDANSIWARALDTFGDEGTARHWMNSARDIFGDAPRSSLSIRESQPNNGVS